MYSSTPTDARFELKPPTGACYYQRRNRVVEPGPWLYRSSYKEQKRESSSSALAWVPVLNRALGVPLMHSRRSLRPRYSAIITRPPAGEPDQGKPRDVAPAGWIWDFAVWLP
jgi:hypothetical protein